MGPVEVTEPQTVRGEIGDVRENLCLYVHITTSALARGGDLEAVRRVGRGLADLGRLRVLADLRERELCVCHLVDLLGLDASTVSRHVRLLRDAGLVAVRKEGRWLHCRRAEPEALLRHAIDEMLAGSDQLDLDERRLRDGDCC